MSDQRLQNSTDQKFTLSTLHSGRKRSNLNSLFVLNLCVLPDLCNYMKEGFDSRVEYIKKEAPIYKHKMMDI